MIRTLAKTSVYSCLASVSTVLLVLVVACGGHEIGRTVDVSVTVDLPESIPPGSPLDIGYTWTPNSGFSPPADDFKVFVNIVDPDGNIVEQDDHFPVVPTSQWRAGQPFTYRHLIYSDPGLRVDQLSFYVGLYDDEGKVGTMYEGRFQERPLVHTMLIRTDDQGGRPGYLEGFTEEEVLLTSHDAYTRQWRWMGSRGLVQFRNPRGPATLHLRALSPVDFVGGNQSVSIKMGGREIDWFTRTDSSSYLLYFDVPDEELGDGDWVELTIEVDKVFVPAQVTEGSTDTRELGLQVFWMYLLAH